MFNSGIKKTKSFSPTIIFSCRSRGIVLQVKPFHPFYFGSFVLNLSKNEHMLVWLEPPFLLSFNFRTCSWICERSRKIQTREVSCGHIYTPNHKDFLNQWTTNSMNSVGSIWNSSYFYGQKFNHKLSRKVL